jgi:hypothetical protein
MTSPLCRMLVLCMMLILASSANAASTAFSFGVIPREARAMPEDSALQEAIEESDAENLAFVVASGVKAADQDCTDDVYNRRKKLLQNSKHGLVLSLAGSDWSTCRNNNGRSAAAARLGRLRELFFDDEFSMGATRIPVVRQSTVVKFDDFVENARWEIGRVMFATVNLPSPNNHYLTAAGRNGEFEDRLVANRDWLNRVFLYATRDRLAGIVLFTDGNPLMRGAGKRDGYAETRREILKLARRFRGKVLIVHGQPQHKPGDPAIRWRGNVGEIGVTDRWLSISVHPGNANLFSAQRAGKLADEPR